MEKWLNIPGLDARYSVSNLGRIRSFIKGEYHIKTPIVLKPGYLRVGIGKKRYLVHRLVAMAFVSNPMFYQTVNHKNGIKTDNRVENLEWITQKENVRHSWKMGMSKARPMQGELSPSAKYDEGFILMLRDEYAEEDTSYRKLADKYNMYWGTVRDIVKRRSWKHV